MKTRAPQIERSPIPFQLELLRSNCGWKIKRDGERLDVDQPDVLQKYVNALKDQSWEATE